MCYWWKGSCRLQVSNLSRDWLQQRSFCMEGRATCVQMLTKHNSSFNLKNRGKVFLSSRDSINLSSAAVWEFGQVNRYIAIGANKYWDAPAVGKSWVYLKTFSFAACAIFSLLTVTVQGKAAKMQIFLDSSHVKRDDGMEKVLCLAAWFIHN